MITSYIKESAGGPVKEVSLFFVRPFPFSKVCRGVSINDGAILADLLATTIESSTWGNSPWEPEGKPQQNL